MLSDAIVRDAQSAAIWTNEHSERFHALALHGVQAGTQVVVGVVVLKVGNARASVGSLNQLATAVGTYLLGIGDARGV
jgi:hypothetical protein